jgi:hypothetical protein
MTQPSRTTETINRDNAAIRDIMHQIRELTVPDRATLALGLVGHLATLMNGRQMSKLMSELQEEARRVQDVPPSRQRDEDRGESGAAAGEHGFDKGRAPLAAGGRGEDRDARGGSDRTPPQDGNDSVGQAGRGEFRAGRLL